MKSKLLLIGSLLAILVISLPVKAQEPSPEDVVLLSAEAINVGDVDTAASYYAEDAFVNTIPALPPGAPITRSGAEAIRAWFEELVAINFRMEIEIVEVIGDVVIANTLTWNDATEDMGVAPLVANEIYIVQHGQIVGYTWVLSDESLDAVMTALASASSPNPVTLDYLLGVWKWDNSSPLYLQLNPDGTYFMHAGPWPSTVEDKDMTLLEKLVAGPGDRGTFQFEDGIMTLISGEETIVCDPGEVTVWQITMLDADTFQLEMQEEACGVRRPPNRQETMSRIAQ